MSHRQKFSNRAHAQRLTVALIAAVLLWLPAGNAAASKSKAPAATPEIAEKQADLGELRSRIEGLRKELGASEENKADAGDRLRESERQISRLQRELHELGNQRGQLQKNLQFVALIQRKVILKYRQSLGNHLHFYGQHHLQLHRLRHLHYF